MRAPHSRAGTLLRPRTATDLLRGWGWITAVVWFLAGWLLVAMGIGHSERAAAWPFWCAASSFVASASSLILALHPKSAKALGYAVAVAVFTCSLRAMALLLVDLPHFPDAGRWLGVVFYLGLAQTIVFMGTVFHLAQLGAKTE